MKYSHLKHIDLPEHYQFITFRTQDSVDSYVKKMQSQYSNAKEQQYAIDQYLDQSPNGAHLTGDVLVLLTDYLIDKGKLYEMVAFAIMPNHVHLLIKPLKELSIVMQKIKGGSARLINQQMGRKGVFWAEEYYDKLIRDEQHFKSVYNYIKNNPLALGDPKGSPPRFYGIYS